MLRRPGLLDKAHSAVNLYSYRGEFHAEVGGKRLADRSQQRSTFLAGGAGRLVRSVVRSIE